MPARAAGRLSVLLRDRVRLGFTNACARHGNKHLAGCGCAACLTRF